MTNKSDLKTVKDFYDEVCRDLPRSGPAMIFKEAFREELLEYARDNPNLTRQDLSESFGDPRSIVSGFSEPEIYERYLEISQKKARFWRNIAVLMWVLTALLIGTLICILIL